jgi:hypothetical protein
MFGRHEAHRPDGPQELDVDHGLEDAISTTEASIDAYLAGPSDDLRQRLLTALEQLDARIDASDTFEGTIVGVGGLGMTDRYRVVGETGPHPLIEEVPSGVFELQTELVKAAKQVVRAPSPEADAALRAARAAQRAAEVNPPPPVR